MESVLLVTRKFLNLTCRCSFYVKDALVCTFCLHAMDLASSSQSDSHIGTVLFQWYFSSLELCGVKFTARTDEMAGQKMHPSEIDVECDRCSDTTNG